MPSLLSKIVFRFIECEETMRLLSRAMDEQIGLRHRIAIRLHCLCCPGCTNYRLQLPWLRSALQQIQENRNLERIATFTAEEKEHLNRLLKSADGK